MSRGIEPSTRMPRSSTGTGTTASPPSTIDRRYSASDGSSTAIRRAPRAASACAMRPRPWMNPVDTTTVSGATAIPRTRLRYAGERDPQLRGAAPAEVQKRSAGASARRGGSTAARPRAGTRSRRAGRAGSRTATRHREVGPARSGCSSRRGRPGSRRRPSSRGIPRPRAARTPPRRSRARRPAGSRARGSRAGSSRPPAALADPRPEVRLELPVERLGASPVERDEELDVGTGPRSSHRSGP